MRILPPQTGGKGGGHALGGICGGMQTCKVGWGEESVEFVCVRGINI